MARAKRRDAWDHTANLLALIINVNRDPKKGQPATAESIHPFEQQEPLTAPQKEAVMKEQMACLKERAFGGKVTYIKPFIPANQEQIDAKRRKNKSRAG